MKTVFQENYVKLTQLIPDVEKRTHAILQSPAKHEVLLMLKQTEEDNPIYSLSNYQFEHKDLLPKPEVSFMLQRKKKQIKVMSYLDKSELVEVYPVIEGTVQQRHEAIYLLNIYLNGWLENLQQQSFQLLYTQWQRLPQERNDQDYAFKAIMVITQGIQTELSSSEIALIVLDLQRFVRENNECVDYLQVYEKEGQKIYCIDQLSQGMIQGDDYSEKEKEEYNYFTIMLAEEY